ncbi:MAG: pyruvate kinase, partial [gamma proteobacterium symbiont of Taylorina sp.]|nr:pyruvate kinase [gamma proteobacterium symbiont of Taylorina sp.]
MTKKTIHRKTKIVATIGPASDSPEIIQQMIEAGMNVARLNMSFGVDEVQQQRLDRIRRVSRDMGRFVAIMADTKGIEIRTGKLEGGKIEINAADTFILYSYKKEGNQQGVSVNYANLHN